MVPTIAEDQLGEVVEEERSFKLESVYVGGFKLCSNNKRTAWNKEKQRLTTMQWLVKNAAATLVDDLPLGEINEVYLLDFIGSSGFIGELYPKVESVIILDHHKTAVEALCGNASFGKNVIKVIDMDKSGATIAFDFFKEKLLKRSDTLKGLGIHNYQEAGQKNLSGCKFERVQKLFEYIEDGDIWRWKLPHSKDFSSGLKDMNIEYNVNVNSALFEQRPQWAAAATLHVQQQPRPVTGRFGQSLPRPVKQPPVTKCGDSPTHSSPRQDSSPPACQQPRPVNGQVRRLAAAGIHGHLTDRRSQARRLGQERRLGQATLRRDNSGLSAATCVHSRLLAPTRACRQPPAGDTVRAAKEGKGEMHGRGGDRRCIPTQDSTVIFVVNSSFLAAGFSLVDGGARIISDKPPIDGEVIGIDGCNELEDAYAFVYTKTDNDSKKIVSVKCLPGIGS
ncbi:hypothetical protein ZIOFF_003250 [Zingiber officinale]|uniref:Uncharacterized protein n=1 Tax=Zingiber officinale TaxID=94328 RepID=A0A8J5LTA4_ZINOF|nr:hypothetical protein ZIOFF_003250 [Zingiber officinale]